MGLIDKILSIFGSGSSAAGPAPPSESEEPAEPEPEPEPDAEAEEADAEAEEAEEEEAEEEDDGGMSTKSVAEMADPRRREGEDNTVHNRAENPADHGEIEEEAEEAEEEEAEEEDDGGMATKAVAEMADPRRREGEDNTVHNRAENPGDHAEAEEEEAEEAEEEEAEEEDDGGMSTKAVAEMADPRRREGEDNTVHNRAENPDDQRAT